MSKYDLTFETLLMRGKQAQEPREPRCRTSYDHSMTTNRSFLHLGRLLEAWNNHQDLRRNGAPVAELAASRAQLDMIRHAG